MTRRHRSGAVVRHVMLRVRQKFAHPETFNFYGLPCAIHTVDNVTLLGMRACAWTRARHTYACCPIAVTDAACYTALIRMHVVTHR